MKRAMVLLPLMVTFLGAIWHSAPHDAGLMWLRITNYGTFGYQDACIWPRGSGESYIFGAGIWVGSLRRVEGVSAQLLSEIDSEATVIPLSSTSSFDSTGVVRIGDELIHYSGLADTCLLNCIRGFASTAPTSHGAGETVLAYRALMTVGYNPSNGSTEFVPGDLPNEPGYSDSLDRIYFSDNPADTALWPLRDSLGNPVVLSSQDSYAMMNDEDSSHCSDPQFIKVMQVGYSWNYHYYEDFIFLNYYIINDSPDTIFHAYLGLVCDADIGDYTDDLVGFDGQRNLGYAYDSDFNEPGWANTPGYIGFDFLESPLDTTGNQLGLTAFKILRNPGVPGAGQPDPDNDDQAYQLAAGYNYTDGTYHPMDSITTPTDVRFVQFTGPFDLAPGDTAKVVIAVIAGADSLDLQHNSDLAQNLYDIGFITDWVHVLSPNGGEEISGTYTIAWEDSSVLGAPLTVDISYSRDNGETWEDLVTDLPDQGYYEWNTVGFPDGTRYRIRVTVHDTVAVGEDISDTTFTVNNPGNGAPDVIFLSPNGGRLSDTVEVTWWADDPDHDSLAIDILIFDGSSTDTLASGLPNTGSFLWNTRITDNGDYRIAVQARDGETLSADTSRTVSVINDHEIGGTVEHVLGGCDVLSILPLIYFPDSLNGHKFEIRFNRIQSAGSGQPLYTFDLYDLTLGTHLLDDFPLSTRIDGMLYVDYTPAFGGIVYELDSQIDADGFRFISFRILENSSGFDGHLSMLGQDSLGTAPPLVNYRWAFRGSDYEIRWVSDSTFPDSITLQVWDITNDVEIPYDSVTGDNWHFGYPGQASRYFDPEVHTCFYLSGGLFYFNQDGSMTHPPGPGDVWFVKSAGPKAPASGNVYWILPLSVDEKGLGKAPSAFLRCEPNPFSGKLRILYSIPEDGPVELSLYDVSGRLVKRISRGFVRAGAHTLYLDGRIYPSGVYFLRMKSPGFRRVKKLLLIK